MAVSSNQSSLEKLPVPKFNGSQSEWQRFKDKFTSMVIKDPTISSIIKLERLQQGLFGKAEKLISGIRGTGENFQLAWDTLCRQYDNVHRRLEHQLDFLLNLPAKDEVSVDHLNLLLTAVNESITVFQDLGCSTDKWNEWLIHCVVRRLDSSTRFEWAKVLGKDYAKSFPEYKVLASFLEERIQTLLISMREHSAEEQSSKGSKGQLSQQRSSGASAHFASNTGADNNKRRPTCAMCGEAYFIGYCQKFRTCSQSERLAQVQAASLCENCLNPGHIAEACTSQGRCMVPGCDKKHHTRFHPPIMNNVVPSNNTCYFTEGEQSAAVYGERRTKILGTALACYSLSSKWFLNSCASSAGSWFGRVICD